VYLSEITGSVNHSGTLIAGAMRHETPSIFL
jgi:hypothetical protein